MKKSTATRLSQTWQCLQPSSLPDLFYAYDSTQNRMEKVVSFKLSDKGLKYLQQLDLSEKYEIGFLLGSKKPSTSGIVEDKPRFAPHLAVYRSTEKDKSGKDKWEKLVQFKLSWERNPHFLDTKEGEGLLSGIDAIPAAGAFLFVANWLRHPSYLLNSVFESETASAIERVRAYFYSSDESRIIMEEARKHDKGTKVDVFIHLGVGISVEDHLFSFRPVLEVHAGDAKNKLTALQELANSSFFDFSRPCPHFCKE
jgi:hypothetical protein